MQQIYTHKAVPGNQMHWSQTVNLLSKSNYSWWARNCTLLLFWCQEPKVLGLTPNFIPLWKWMWCHKVYLHMYRWACDCIFLTSEHIFPQTWNCVWVSTVPNIKYAKWHHVHSESGIKFRILNVISWKIQQTGKCCSANNVIWLHWSSFHNCLALLHTHWSYWRRTWGGITW